MNPEFWGWCLALGFLLAVALLFFAWSDHKSINPFAPFIRAYETRQKHKHELAKIRLRAELARKGIDPGYIKFLEDELNKNQ